jgi:thiol-disulfide isomerase/thioredoxin
MLLTTANTVAADSSVLLAFTASWCPNCQQMSSALDSLEQDGCAVRRVDVDREQSLVQRLGVERVPTYIIMSAGREAARFVGVTEQAVLRTALQPVTATRLGETSVSGPAAAGPSFGGLPTPAVLQGPENQPPVPSPSGSVGGPSPPLVAAAVRLRITDGSSTGIGSGTIIDIHDEEALVLTCGHLFRECQGQAPIAIDLFRNGETITVPGQVLDYSAEERDIALVVCRPGIPVAPVQVAPAKWQPQSGESVFSLGCDRGADPSRRDTRITAINKYLGPPNLEIAGAPIDGRSGGGLFNSAGQLIGVCNAADPQDDEGIYAGLEVVHWQLDRINLSHLYRTSDGPVSLVSTNGPPPATGSTAQDAGPSALTGPMPTDLAAGQEVIVIVRDRGSAQGATRVLEFSSVPPQIASLLQTPR